MEHIETSHLSVDQRLALEKIDQRLSTRLGDLHRWAVLGIHTWILSAVAITRAGIRAAPSLHRISGHGSLAATIINSRSGVISHQCGLVNRTHERADAVGPIDSEFTAEELCFTQEQFTWLCIPDSYNPYNASTRSSMRVRRFLNGNQRRLKTNKSQHRRGPSPGHTAAESRSIRVVPARSKHHSGMNSRAHGSEQPSRSRRWLCHRKSKSLTSAARCSDTTAAPRRRASDLYGSANARSDRSWYLHEGYTPAASTRQNSEFLDCDVTLMQLNEYLASLNKEETSGSVPSPTFDLASMEADALAGAPYPNNSGDHSISPVKCENAHMELDVNTATFARRPSASTVDQNLALFCPSIYGESDSASSSGDSFLSMDEVDALFDIQAANLGAEDQEMFL